MVYTNMIKFEIIIGQYCEYYISMYDFAIHGSLYLFYW